MQFPSPVSLSWLSEFLGASLMGDVKGSATGINEIHKVEKGDLVFVDHPKYYEQCLRSAASFIIINQVVECPPGKALLVVDEPFEAYLKIVKHFRPFEGAVQPVSPDAQIGKTSFVYPGTFIGNHVQIGENCLIHPNVSILDHCIIGNNVIIQAGTVIGSDAFYYNTKKNREIWYKKMLSCGRVLIEDDVEIGAGCTIDRGVTSDTVIGKGCRLDNMVHIGHDTTLGKNCLIAAQVAVAGAVDIGDGVILWGQVGVSKTLRIGDHAVVLAQSGVGKDLDAGKIYFGSPCDDASVKKRELVWVKRIPELWKKVMEKG
ncbi:MAG: UDP-3-O-(3-hydroxymyristoyl)glucosamine N-acyltransferase [Bacteroidota bacterium]|nr:UDP-3-O-(3-hydroxymyristoyl)glucosamine N-acyltransferase [Bacteroidota bacterium]MDP4212789.1 UDP-3-O-(3-hydroxymyristoyl)glucosamine N-acyltransferase [Bacteroidota bacterium]MDP4250235.1 UDP-3-O-(3-hydroxymyristoyl)glucosamine N-acyltransferase [Bacteroidota bacterium]